MSPEIIDGFTQASQLTTIIAVASGCFIGLIIGMIPGLTISTGIIIVLPLTFVLEPDISIALLLGLYVSGMTGGSFSAILLNIPGTPSASATALDGHPMAVRGEAGRALGIAIIASFIGGLFSFLCLYFIAPVLAEIALKFKSPDLFSLVFFGLTIICSFAAKSLIKGLLSAVIGLAIVTIGQDPMMGTTRFTFDHVNLISGIHFLTALIGLFAIPQLVDNFADVFKGRSQKKNSSKINSILPKISDLKLMRLPIIIGAPIGSFLGILPGAGGPIAAFISYDYAKKMSKKPEEFGKLSKGKFLAAQVLFDKALKANPRDVYALFGKGIILQHRGELNHARQVFEAVLAVRPSSDQKLLVINDLAPQTIRELADLNLSLLDSKGVSNAFGPPGRPGNPSRNTSLSRTKLSAPVLSRRIRGSSLPITPGITSRDKNIIARFKTLKELTNQGLLTPAEYAVRRKRNLGALTSLTAKPPAAGLTRSVPSVGQISRRLKAIGRALELRAITIRQHGAERKMIIDGLMPANPKVYASPAIAPKGLMAAATAVRRVEMLKEGGLISKDEYIKEKAAIEKILAPTTPAIAKSVTGAKTGPSVITSKGGPKPALHLASFRSKKSANRAWLQLRRAHKSILGKMKSEVTRVNLGRSKGVYYRLISGPFSSSSAAARACKKLKSRRQYCDAAFMGGS